MNATIKRIYISGKIGGLSVDEFTTKFNAIRDSLMRSGKEVISPIDLPHDHDKSWASYMLEDLHALANCDSIYMLSCWRDSPGARIEHDFASRMGLTIIYENKI